MPVQREFLGCGGLFLENVADYLLNLGLLNLGPLNLDKHEFCINLAQLTVIIPSARSERRLIEILASKATENNSALIPPTVFTVGALPELLYTPQKPFASTAECRLAWITALRETPRDVLSQLAPHLDPSAGVFGLSPLADTLLRLWVSELSPFRLRFSDVASICEQQISDYEAKRWEALEIVFSNYVKTLSGMGLSDRECERLSALKEKRCSYNSPLILAACADLRPMATAMLTSVDAPVTALIALDQSYSDGFTEWGQYQPDYWSKASLPLAEDSVLIADGPSEQAGCVAEVLRQRAGHHSIEDVTLSCLDPNLSPFINERMEAEGYLLRDAQGKPLSESLPARLLEAISDYISAPTYQNFAALLRHADIGAVNLEEHERLKLGDCVSLLDEHQGEYLQSNQSEGFRGKFAAVLAQASLKLESLLGELLGQGRSLQDWKEPIHAFLTQCYGSKELTPSNREAYSSISDAIEDALSHEGLGIFTASEALYLLLRHISGLRLPPDAIEQEVELLGWLELPLDDSSLLVVCGMNEGFVPESITGDMFLPNKLRQLLSITSDETRLARDSYIATVLNSSARETVYIAGRLNTSGDALLPSRILLRDEVSLAKRILSAYRDPSAAFQILPGTEVFDRDNSQLSTQIPMPATPVESLSVTAFRDYISCPFRFYLKHILRLESETDDVHELEPAAFGIVIHEVLSQFAAKADSDILSNESKINALLHDLLQRLRIKWYGSAVLPAVRIQFEQIEQRLKSFARWQSEWTKQGWLIDRTEFSVGEKHAMLDIGGKEPAMKIKARIDRLDFHPASGKWMIIDYKTPETSLLPKAAYTRDGDWLDVQLPLYELLVRRELETSAEIGLSYLNLSASSTDHAVASWDSVILEQGVETAREIAYYVRTNVFLPPSERTKYSNDVDILLEERSHLPSPGRSV